MKKQILSEQFRRMQKLAGLITENEINEETDILSFLKVPANRLELVNKLATKFKWDEDYVERMKNKEGRPFISKNADGDEDPEIVGLGESGLDFSFSAVKMYFIDRHSTFSLVIAGKPIYGVNHNM